MRSTKVKQTEKKILRLTDEMLEIDMKGIRQVLYVYVVVKNLFQVKVILT